MTCPRLNLINFGFLIYHFLQHGFVLQNTLPKLTKYKLYDVTYQNLILKVCSTSNENSIDEINNATTGSTNVVMNTALPTPSSFNDMINDTNDFIQNSSLLTTMTTPTMEPSPMIRNITTSVKKVLQAEPTSLRRNLYYYQIYYVYLNTIFASILPLLLLLFFNINTAKVCL